MKEFTLTAPHVQSLVWVGEVLLDLAGGGVAFHLDGRTGPRRTTGFGSMFDSAISLADGSYAVVYGRYGTKGVVLKSGDMVREINRSFYFADRYEYPIALGLLRGRTIIIHCPDVYNRLEIEDAETGERLKQSQEREPADIFHSRLSLSPDGRFLLDNGWHWQPIDTVRLFDLDDAARAPGTLDGKGVLPPMYADDMAAMFDAEGRLLVYYDGDIDDERPLQEVSVTDPATRTLLSTHVVAQKLGRFMPIGQDFVLGLYEHPRLVDLRSGETVRSWPDIKTGTQTGPIGIRDGEFPMAMDVANRRFAVACAGNIRVLEFDA